MQKCLHSFLYAWKVWRDCENYCKKDSSMVKYFGDFEKITFCFI